MSTSSPLNHLDTPLVSPARDCEVCGESAGPVRTEQRGVIWLCATHLGAELRRRLPWRRYLRVVAACLAMVPVLAFVAGTGSDAIEFLRSGAEPTGRTLPATVTYGWDILTAVTDHWASFGVAVAVAVPLALIPIASQGEAILRRAETAQTESLDDHARLMLLDSGLWIITCTIALTTVLTLVLAVDALIDTAAGGAQQFLFSMILAGILIVEASKVSVFPNFADQSRMLVKADFARGVRERRERAFGLGWASGLRALAVTLALHVLLYLAIAFPAGPTAVGRGLTFALLGLSSSCLVAASAYAYLRDGDRPAGALTVATGGVVGIFWTSVQLTVAVDQHFHMVNGWGVLLGCGLLLPLYLLISLGLIGTGPLHGLAYFTARIDDGNTAIKSAVRNRKHRSARPAQSTQDTTPHLERS